MTNTPTPNPNRRRRLTADELIAVIVAMTGIGSILFWSLGQKYPSFNLANWDSASLTGSNNSNVNTNGVGAAEDGSTNTTINGGVSTTRSIGNAPATVPIASNNTHSGVVTTKATKDRRIIDDEKDSNTGRTAMTTIAPIAAGTAAGTTAGTAPAPATAAPSPVSTAAPFKDVPKAFWGEKYISTLQQRGVLDDFGTGKFDPNLPVTRGEFAKMLDRAFKDRQIPTKKLGFKDIPVKYQRKEALDRSVNLGFMTGYSPTKFAPDAPIPRYQMTIALAKGLKLPSAANAES